MLSVAVSFYITSFINRDSRQARKNQASQLRTQKRNDNLIQKRLGKNLFDSYKFILVLTPLSAF